MPLDAKVVGDNACVACDGTGYRKYEGDNAEDNAIPFLCNRCDGTGAEPVKEEQTPMELCQFKRILDGYSCSVSELRCEQCPRRAEIE